MSASTEFLRFQNGTDTVTIIRYVLGIGFGLFLCIQMYLIMLNFLNPLLWAVLIAIFLFPFQESLCAYLKLFLIFLYRNQTPLFIQIVYLPVILVKKLVHLIDYLYLYHWIAISLVNLFAFLLFLIPVSQTNSKISKRTALAKFIKDDTLIFIIFSTSIFMILIKSIIPSLSSRKIFKIKKNQLNSTQIFSSLFMFFITCLLQNQTLNLSFLQLDLSFLIPATLAFWAIFKDTLNQLKFYFHSHLHSKYLSQNMDSLFMWMKKGAKPLITLEQSILQYLLFRTKHITSILVILFVVTLIISIFTFGIFKLIDEGSGMMILIMQLLSTHVQAESYVTPFLKSTLGIATKNVSSEAVMDAVYENIRNFTVNMVVIHGGLSETGKDSVLHGIVTISDNIYRDWKHAKSLNMSSIPWWSFGTFPLPGSSNERRNDTRQNGFKFFLHSLRFLNVKYAFSVLQQNFMPLFRILLFLLYMILCGGQAFLALLFSIVTFFTALYLVLTNYNNQSAPHKWILQTIGLSDQLLVKMEKAIFDVFGASLKLSLFYGCYFWCTHSLLSLNMVYLPTVGACILAIIPITNVSLMSLPGAAEIAIKGNTFSAFIFFLLHFLPGYIIDPIIYAEISGSAHPYVTVLAVFGGIYHFKSFGGFIFGPIILCCCMVLFETIRERPSLLGFH